MSRVKYHDRNVANHLSSPPPLIGTIRKENRNGSTYDIEYDVGGWERGVRRYLIRLGPEDERASRGSIGSEQGAVDAAAAKYPPGTRIEVWFDFRLGR